ncbi:MAG: alpha-E domain-containing protein [Planctomycetota bacterium]
MSTSVMLARVANAVYWMSRYIERAENTARFVDVNLQLTLDRSGFATPQWMPLVSITGDEQAFAVGYGTPSRENVLAFLTLDPDYPNSIRSCVERARENARTVRETLTTEMWQQINELYHLLRNTRPAQLTHQFYRDVKRSAMLFTAVTDNAMMHAIGWDFVRLGRMIERADKTSRILDVKYFLLLPSVDDVGTSLDAIQWRALLHSTDALEMYRQKHGTISPGNVVDFLLFNESFPRALAFCLAHGERSMVRLCGSNPHEDADLARREWGWLRSEMQYRTVKEVIRRGLHEYLDDFQGRLNQVDNTISRAFFQPRLPESGLTSL